MALGAGSSRAFADTFDWSSTTTGVSWSDEANWVQGTAPGAGDMAVFNQMLGLSETIIADNGEGGGITIGGIQVGTTNGIKQYIFSSDNGGSITFDNGANDASLTELATAFGDQVNASLFISGNGNLGIVNNASKTFTIGGAITGSAGTGSADTLTLTNGGSGTLLMNGVLSDGSNGGVLSLLLNAGAGAITLNAGNTFTGAVTIQSGLVNLQSGGGLGGANASQTVTIDAGGALNLNGKGLNNLSKGFALNGNGVGGTGALVNNAAGTAILNNAVSLQSNSTVGATVGGITITGLVSGSGKLTTAGAANPVTLNRNAGNSYSGGTVVSSGALAISNTSGSATGSGMVTVNSGAVLSLAGAARIAPDSGNGIELAGTLNPAANTLTLALNGAAKLSFGSGSALALTLGTNSGSIAFSSAGDWPPAAATRPCN